MALRKVQSSLIADSAITGTTILDGSVAAVDLSSTAIADKLGYTPVSPTQLTDGLATKEDTIGYVPVSPTDLSDGLATKVAKTSDTGSAVVPSGSEAQRDGSPSAGYFRFNTSTNSFEGYNGAIWGAVGGGATGGGNDKAFYLNDTVITQSYTIPNGQNAMTAGPVTLQDGVVLTVPDGSVWTVV